MLRKLVLLILIIGFLSAGTLAAQEWPKEITFVDTAGGANFQEFHTSWTIPESNRVLPFNVEYIVFSGAEVIERLKAWKPGQGDMHVLLLKPDGFVGALEAGIPLEVLLPNPSISNAFHIPPKDLAQVLGIPAEGKGLQFWRDQAGFIYNTTHISNPPSSFKELYERRNEFCGRIGMIRPDAKSGGGRIFMYDFLRAFGVDWSKPFDKIKDSPEWKDALAKFTELSKCFHKPLASEPPFLFEQYLKEDISIAEYMIDYTLWSRDRGKLPKTVATTYAGEGLYGGNTLLVVPTDIPDEYKAAAFKFVDWLLSDYVQSTLFMKMWNYPGTEIWDSVPEEAWSHVPRMQDLKRIVLENYDGFRWLKKNGMGAVK